MDLGGVRENEWGLRGEACFDVDTGCDVDSQKLKRLGDDGLKRNALERLLLLPAEGQNLADEISGAPRASFDLGEADLHGMIRG